MLHSLTYAANLCWPPILEPNRVQMIAPELSRLCRCLSLDIVIVIHNSLMINGVLHRMYTLSSSIGRSLIRLLYPCNCPEVWLAPNFMPNFSVSSKQFSMHLFVHVIGFLLGNPATKSKDMYKLLRKRVFLIRSVFSILAKHW